MDILLWLLKIQKSSLNTFMFFFAFFNNKCYMSEPAITACLTSKHLNTSMPLIYSFATFLQLITYILEKVLTQSLHIFFP